jgi:hypothetical protein
MKRIIKSVTTVECNAQWGPCKGKNPYKYLQGLDLEMKAHIEYMWPILHHHLKEFATISLTFPKGIFAKCKNLLVDWLVM